MIRRIHVSDKKSRKQEQLERFTSDDRDKEMTTNHGTKLSEDEFSLKAGERGPTLMEDFHFREKMTHFDHERIPERAVHARGYSAHGEFELYESLEQYTTADFLTDTSKKTPTFTRFSTVAGSKGSAELARDVRGFATKFYTEEGNFDLVGNNMPVFFIQDAIKFPDLVHALKPEPHNGIPQAASAHDTFWDFIANNQESAHMILWAMSPRSIPRSFRMMEGFGVNTFRLVNKEGKGHLVKFHWKPKLGVHSLVWDEAQKVNGKNPDFHRADLYEAIENGDFVEFELGLQIIDEGDEHSFDFDVLDPTKVWPEEEVPVKRVGKLTLNRNVDNVFAENEQVAFHPGHVVPGIDFSNDPLLQGRLFSYTDTQLLRLGGPNFHEIPINQPVCPFHNNQRDGMHRMTINRGQSSYHNNSVADNHPRTVPPEEGGFEHYQEKVEGEKVRARSESFKDHFSQAIMFWNSMSEHEKGHIKDAISFELGKCQQTAVREQVVDMLSNISGDLASYVADNLGLAAPQNQAENITKTSPSLSMANTVQSPETRKIAVLLADGFNGEEVQGVLDGIDKAGADAEIFSTKLGKIKADNGDTIEADHTFLTGDSVLFDAVYVVGGPELSESYKMKAKYFTKEAYMHFKPVGATHDGKDWLEEAGMSGQPGIITSDDLESFGEDFIKAVAAHRFFDRELV
ncbi:catalase [Salimicrobium humidisoli]|uniref:Catalase n=1 Tax=Salimicrobium humidisoli TaxID=2029857 RepID=A0ABX4HU04_9BACI|nr:catalase HPII [Salimicrobium humidisoli]